MRNNLQNDIKVENPNNRKSKFNYSASLSTTCNLGQITPAKCQVIQPNSTTLCKIEELVRMAPMVSPTYAHLKSKTWLYWVPLADVVPNYDPMSTMMKANRNGSVFDVLNLPCIKRKDLSAFLLTGAKATIYIKLSNGNIGSDENLTTWHSAPYQESVNWKRLIDAIWNKYYYADDEGVPLLDLKRLLNVSSPSEKFGLPAGNRISASLCLTDVNQPEGYPFWQYDRGYPTEDVGIDSADALIYDTFTHEYLDENNNVVAQDYEICLAFRFSSFGVQLSKIFDVLGYGRDYMDSRNVEIARLLAYYKGYYMKMYPQQWEGWQDTTCASIVSLCASMSGPAMIDDTEDEKNVMLWDLFTTFVLTELGQMWVAENNDLVSSHKHQPVIADIGNGWGIGINGYTPDAAGSENNTFYNITEPASLSERADQPNVNNQSYHAYMATIYHSFLDEKILNVLTKMQNTNTVIGRNISRLMRAMGLGKYLDDRKVNDLGYWETPIDISTVTSTTDNYDAAKNEGKQLGSYAGKGIGYKNHKPVRFSNEALGYFFAYTAITCDSGYSQGVDETIYCTQEHDFYKPQFDALGEELASKAIICGQMDVGASNRLVPQAPASPRELPFGYRPRLTAFKIARNVISGGFSLKSMRNMFISYNLDKTIYPETRAVIKRTDFIPGGDTPHEQRFDVFRLLPVEDVPTAGIVWRFLGRFPWLGNMLRIFAADSTEQQQRLYYSLSGLTSQNAKVWQYYYRIDDNYMIFQDYTLKTWSHMLPIDETYGTVDPEPKANEYIQRC